jgi:hypothetical protein
MVDENRRAYNHAYGIRRRLLLKSGPPVISEFEWLRLERFYDPYPDLTKAEDVNRSDCIGCVVLLPIEFPRWSIEALLWELRGEPEMPPDSDSDKADVIDETPAAYKDIDAVMAAQADLVDIVHTLKQVLVVKG